MATFKKAQCSYNHRAYSYCLRRGSCCKIFSRFFFGCGATALVSIVRRYCARLWRAPLPTPHLEAVVADASTSGWKGGWLPCDFLQRSCIVTLWRCSLHTCWLYVGRWLMSVRLRIASTRKNVSSAVARECSVALDIMQSYWSCSSDDSLQHYAEFNLRVLISSGWRCKGYRIPVCYQYMTVYGGRYGYRKRL